MIIVQNNSLSFKLSVFPLYYYARKYPRLTFKINAPWIMEIDVIRKKYVFKQQQWLFIRAISSLGLNPNGLFTALKKTIIIPIYSNTSSNNGDGYCFVRETTSCGNDAIPLKNKAKCLPEQAVFFRPFCLSVFVLLNTTATSFPRYGETAFVCFSATPLVALNDGILEEISQREGIIKN